MKTKQTKTVYKVVRNCGGYYVSSQCKVADQLRYELGQITRPRIKNSRIFAFDNLADAISFAGYNMQTVLVCDGEVAEAARTLRAYGPQVAGRIAAYWRGELGTSEIVACPPGTVLCKWVKPLRVVRSGC